MKTLIFVTFFLSIGFIHAQDRQTKSFLSDRKNILQNDSIVEEVNMFNISIKDSLIILNKIDRFGDRESQLYKIVAVEPTEKNRCIIHFRSDAYDYSLEIVPVTTEQNSGMVLNMSNTTLYRVEEYYLKTFYDQ